jgi:hypothetical protein
MGWNWKRNSSIILSAIGAFTFSVMAAFTFFVLVTAAMLDSENAPLGRLSLSVSMNSMLATLCWGLYLRLRKTDDAQTL